MAGRCRLVLVEGLPGSGKSTTGAWIADWLRERGVAAWFAEELARDHPVIGRALRRTGREPGYADRCIDAWSAFAAEHARGDAVAVLEACLFQGTVRFLLEHGHPPGEAARYLAGTERALARLHPRLVYLAAPDARGFLERDFPQRKGADWAGRIAAYSETTPIARRHGWRGAAGCVELYLAYRRLCDELVAAAEMPRLVVDSTARAEPGRARIRAFLEPAVRPATDAARAGG